MITTPASFSSFLISLTEITYFYTFQFSNVANINIMSKSHFPSTLPLKQNSITAILTIMVSFDNHLSHSCWTRAHD